LSRPEISPGSNWKIGLRRKPCEHTVWPGVERSLDWDITRRQLTGILADELGGAFLLFTHGAASPDRQSALALHYIDSDGWAWDDPTATEYPFNGPLYLLGPSSLNASVESGMVHDGVNGCIVVWSDLAGGPRLRAQRVDRVRNILWDAGGVSLVTHPGTTSPRNLSVGSDGSGGAVVAWYEWTDRNPHIYAQRVTSDGTRQWGSNGVTVVHAIGVALESPGEAWRFGRLQIVPDGTGGAYIGWSQPRADGAHDFLVRRLGPDGAPIGEPAPLFTGPHSWLSSLTVRRMVTDNNGGFYVAYATEDRRLWIKHVRDNGTAGTISPPAGQRTLHHRLAFAISSDGAGGALFSWAATASGGRILLFAQRLGPSIADSWGPKELAQFQGVGNRHDSWWWANLTSIVPRRSGGTIVIWHDQRSEAPLQLYFRCIDARATEITAERQIGELTGQSREEHLSTTDAEGAIIGWSTKTVNRRSYGIQVQRIRCCWTPRDNMCLVPQNVIGSFSLNSSELGVSFPCNDRGTAVGMVPVPEICSMVRGLNCPGCLEFRDTRCPNQVRIRFDDVPEGINVALHSATGTKIVAARAVKPAVVDQSRKKSKANVGGESMEFTFSPDAKRDYVLVFRTRKKVKPTDVFRVRVAVEIVPEKGIRDSKQ
jgi:hypothetical protein